MFAVLLYCVCIFIFFCIFTFYILLKYVVEGEGEDEFIKFAVASKTSSFVKCQTVANTNPWTRATTYLLLLGGRLSRIPGVNTKNNRAIYRNINKLNIFS